MHALPTDRPVLEAHEITVRFGDVTALDHVSCAWGGTGVHGLIGVNGAGKTTLIHALTGLLPVTSGRVTLSRPLESIAYCPDTPSFEPWFTAREVLLQSAVLGRSGHPVPSAATVDGVLDRVGLAAVRTRRVGGFSRGMRQRLGLAAALIRTPELLLLDEPTSALDPIGRDDVMRLVRELGSSMLVVFSSHILDDVDAVADHVHVLDRGVLAYSGPKAGFVDQHAGTGDVAVVMSAHSAELGRRLDHAGCPWRADDSSADTILVPESRLDTVLDGLRGLTSDLVSLRRTESSLTRAFLGAVSSAEQGAPT
jgi:ABC-2 type transport system ATP-binding protein